jgi:RNA polymerase sigma-32 factor
MAKKSKPTKKSLPTKKAAKAKTSRLSQVEVIEPSSEFKAGALGNEPKGKADSKDLDKNLKTVTSKVVAKPEKIVSPKILGPTPKSKSSKGKIKGTSSNNDSSKESSKSKAKKDVRTVEGVVVDSKKDPLEVATTAISARSDTLGAYLAEIRKYPLLTPEEEYKIAVRYFENKDPKSAERLITSNLRFVVKIAAEYSKFGSKMIDLIQEGNVGLMHAVKDFNPYKGVRLITYAVWWIRGYIREYLLRHYSMVRIGTTQNQKKLFYNLQNEIQELEGSGELVTTALLSERMGLPEKDVNLMQQRMSRKDVSLDQPLDDASKSRLVDIQSSGSEPALDEVLALKEQLSILEDQIALLRPELGEKELYILENRLLADNPMTLQEIGDHYGITRERTRQIESRVMEKLKEKFLKTLPDLDESHQP